MSLPLRVAAPLLCALVLPLCAPVGQAADATAPKGKAPAMQAASSGPVHEAFAAPRPVSLEPPPLVEKAPPGPLNEDIPSEKPEGDNVQWIPGYWDYDRAADKFVWVSGVWRTPPPGRQWAAGYWTAADGQWRRQPGFWTAFSETSKNQEVVYYPKPPEPKGENMADAPPNTVFAPGSWTYGTGGYTWSPGQFIASAPGWSWTAASYSWTPAGYTYTRGYWDYMIARRGLAYAPVVFPTTVRNVANYYYRPTRVIAPSSIANSLTVVGGTRGYYLKNATITGVSGVTGVKLVPVTPAQRAELRNLSAKLNTAAIVRSRLEAKGSATLAGGPVKHTLDLPRPKTPVAGTCSLRPPPRPAAPAAARKAPPPPPRTGPPPAKKPPAKKPAPKKEHKK
jgi:hypothetical protein